MVGSNNISEIGSAIAFAMAFLALAKMFFDSKNKIKVSGEEWGEMKEDIKKIEKITDKHEILITKITADFSHISESIEDIKQSTKSRGEAIVEIKTNLSYIGRSVEELKKGNSDTFVDLNRKLSVLIGEKQKGKQKKRKTA